jgi:hypothetical protein
MGMMDMGAMPQQIPQQAPQQGMMGGQPPQQGGNPSTSHGKYNGTVMVNGEPVQVQNGAVQAEGQVFMVSDDGAMVVDGQGKLVGHIEGNQFVLVDQKYMDMMVEKGYVQ